MILFMKRVVAQTAAMQNLAEDLILLALVVESGNYTAASRASHITKSRLSRRISDLESRLGVELIDRTSRRFRVTEVGLALSRHGVSIRGEADAAIAFAQESLSEPKGPLRVTCPTVLAELVVGGLAARFATCYPNVQLTLDVTSGMPDLALGHYDLALRASFDGLPDSDMIAARLLLTPYEVVATPQWIANSGGISRPEDLDGRDAIGWWQIGSTPRWRLQFADGKEFDIEVFPRFLTNNLNVARSAALAGLGMARLPRPLCARDIESRKLARVFPELTARPMAIYATYHSRRALTLAGRLFLSELQQVLSAWANGDNVGAMEDVALSD